MTFLQPIVLWGLPLILVPILIHLINRLRHRPQPWAAMQFLVKATRNSVSQAKLRQFLILLFRILAVLTLVLFLGRPLAGGWLGWAVAAAPDAIIILLDRSSSMEAQAPGSTTTLREQALKLLSDTAKSFGERSHLILIESALRVPQQIANAASLPQLSLTTPTDTAADIPAMMQAAAKWLIDNQAGTAEIWIASDLQRSNWQPGDTRWQSLTAQLAALPQKVRVRLLSFGQEQQPNNSIALREVTRRQKGNLVELQLVSDFQRNTTKAETVPLGITLDGTRSQVELSMDGPALRWRHKLELGDKKGGGWGMLEIPADANRRDNTNFFVYGPETQIKASIISSDRKQIPFFQYSAVSPGVKTRQIPKAVEAAQFDASGWAEDTLLVWQETLPNGPAADKVRSFVEEGGTAIFFPPGKTDAQRFLGIGWAEVQSNESARNYRVARWDEDQGPLAKTDEGLSLPVAQLSLQKRQPITGYKNVLASFEDGTPFLVRETLGRGEIFFCASLPGKEWSNLGEGQVLVPMIQRLLQSGSRRLQQTASIECGTLGLADQNLRWTSLDSTVPKDIRFQAGVYQSGDRLLAVNRPRIEDEPEMVGIDEAHRLFGSLPFHPFQESGKTSTDQMQGEFWRFFLFGMLIFLVIESVLVLPPRQKKGKASQPPADKRPKTPSMQEAAS